MDKMVEKCEKAKPVNTVIETAIKWNRPQRRNDKCRCGSGKKYKNCCLRTAYSAR